MSQQLDVWSATSRASLISGRIVLMRVSKPKANTEHLLYCFSVIVMTFKAYITVVMNKLTCFVSQGRARTTVKRGGKFFCCCKLPSLSVSKIIEI